MTSRRGDKILSRLGSAAGSSRAKSYCVVFLMEPKKYIVVSQSELSFTQDKDVYLVNYNGNNYHGIVAVTGDQYAMETYVLQLRSFEAIRSKFNSLGNASQHTQTYDEFTTESAGDTPQCLAESSSEIQSALKTLWTWDEDLGVLPLEQAHSEVDGGYHDADDAGANELLHIDLCSQGPSSGIHLQEEGKTSGDGEYDHPDDPGANDTSPQTVELLHIDPCPQGPSSNIQLHEEGNISGDGEYDHPDDPGANDTSPQTVELLHIDPCPQGPSSGNQLQEERKTSGIKKRMHFCKFCKQHKSNISRHFTLMHGGEEEVGILTSLPRNSMERKRWEGNMRRTGDAEYNKILQEEGKCPITIRKGVVDTLPCPNCKLPYNKTTLNRHYVRCANKRAPKNLLKIASSESNPKELPQNLCSEFIKHVLPGMSEDNVNNCILNDHDILEFGNSLALRHAGDIRNKKNLVRSQMRSVAKLRIMASEIDNSILKLRDLFQPDKWNSFVEACRTLGNIGKEVEEATPYNIIHVGLSMSNIAKDLKALTPITDEGKHRREEIQAWIDLYNRKFQTTVGRHAVKVARERRWKKAGCTSYLPIAEDVVKLTNYLKQEIETTSNSLKQKFVMEDFERLTKATMLHLLTFNRKRVAEVALLTVSDYKRKEMIQQNSDTFQSLEESEKIFANNFHHVLVKGKWHRPVPVLFNRKHTSAIDLILKMRPLAAVHDDNPYVFGKGKDLHYDASTCMSLAALECKAKFPKNLTTTALRKHVSTVAQSLELSENDLRVLSGFLGHTVQTHMEHYRQPSDVVHAARVSKILVALDRGEISKFKGKRLEDINVEEEDIPITAEEIQTTTPINKSTQSPPQNLPKKRKLISSQLTTQDLDSQPSTSTTTILTSPLKRTPTKTSPQKKSPFKTRSPSKRIKIRWTETEKKLMRSCFADNLKQGTLPTFNDCYLVRSQHKGLEGRQVQKMKAWVYNELKRRKKTRYESESDSN